MIDRRKQRPEESTSKCQHLSLGAEARGDSCFLLSAFLYYINSLQCHCTAFIFRKKYIKPCYFWREQNLRGHSDFVLFVLCTSRRINSDFGLGCFEHMSRNPGKVYSETSQSNCSQSGHLTTLRPFTLAQGQCTCPFTDICQGQWLSRDPGLTLCSASPHSPSEVPFLPQRSVWRRQEGRRANKCGSVLCLRWAHHALGGMEEAAAGLPRIFREGSNIWSKS